MSEALQSDTAAPAIAAVPVTPEPAVASPPAAPVTSEAAPAPTDAPAAPTDAPTAPADGIPPSEPSLLQKFDEEAAKTEKPKTEAEKAADPAKPADPAAADAAKAVEAAAEAPVYTDLKLPEGFSADTEKMGVYTALLGEHRMPAEAGQKLLDLHADAMKTFADTYAKETVARQYEVFNETKRDWQKQVMADPDIGGAGHQTAMGVIARMRDRLWPTAEDREALQVFDAVTGAGSHPAFLKGLYRLGKILDEPRPAPAEIQPTKYNGRPPGSRAAALYDNPSSSHNR